MSRRALWPLLGLRASHCPYHLVQWPESLRALLPSVFHFCFAARTATSLASVLKARGRPCRGPVGGFVIRFKFFKLQLRDGLGGTGGAMGAGPETTGPGQVGDDGDDGGGLGLVWCWSGRQEWSPAGVWHVYGARDREVPWRLKEVSSGQRRAAQAWRENFVSMWVPAVQGGAGARPWKEGRQACGDREKQRPCTCPPPLIPPPNPPKNLLEPVPTADTRPHPQRV